MKTKRILLVGIAFISITLGLTALRNDDKSFEISKQLNIYATLFRDVNMFYVDEVNNEVSYSFHFQMHRGFQLLLYCSQTLT